MSQVSREEIERIVRRVLAALLATPATPSVPAAAPASETTTVTAQRTLQLDERVVSLRSLEGRLEGIQQVLLPRGAVVTPAARDELKRRGIALQSAASGGNGKPAAEKSGANRILVAATGPIDAASFAASLGEGYAADLIPAAADLAATLGKWSDAVMAKRLPGVILTDQPAATMVLANRNFGIRAVLGSSPREAADAAAAIGANGLVIDTRGRGKFEITAMVKAFARGGWRSAPEALRRALNGT